MLWAETSSDYANIRLLIDFPFRVRFCPVADQPTIHCAYGAMTPVSDLCKPFRVHLYRLDHFNLNAKS
jgi:hypothetical protein